MKKLLVLVALIALSLVAGCGGGVKTYTDPTQTISIGANQEFVIALSSNPTTGYSWQEGHDEAILELVEKEYKLGKAAEKGVVGAGGVEHFRFKALKKGSTKVTMTYKRPWEQEIAEQKVFTVDIK